MASIDRKLVSIILTQRFDWGTRRVVFSQRAASDLAFRWFPNLDGGADWLSLRWLCFDLSIEWSRLRVL